MTNFASQLLKRPSAQYAAAGATFMLVSALNLWLQKWLGYQALALTYLLSVVLLALVLNRGPIFLGTVLTAAGWNYFFAPPAFAFNISDAYDNMMLLTYFVVTLTVGQLTTQLRMRRDAELQAKVLAESERLGRLLLNSVSHELRTPIAAITSATNTLTTTGALTAEQQILTGEIESATVRLNRLVQKLLSAARLQAGHIRPKMDWCDVADLLRVTLRGINRFTEGSTIQTWIAPEVSLVKADFVLMEQALANVIVNAVMHTPKGTVVRIVVWRGPRDLVIEVEDNGPGLPGDQLERVFELFHRAPDAKPGGTGLGLAIAKGFIEAQGGKIEASNRKGSGAVFTIRLPIKENPKLPNSVYDDSRIPAADFCAGG